MAKGKGNPNGNPNGIAIPVYLDTETYKMQLETLPRETNAAVKVLESKLKNALEVIHIHFKIDIADMTDTRLVEKRKREMEREMSEVIDATNTKMKAVLKKGGYDPLQVATTLKLDLNKKELDISLNKAKDSVTDFVDKFKGLMQLPKLNIDISQGEKQIKILDKALSSVETRLNKLNTKQDKTIERLGKRGVIFDENKGISDVDRTAALDKLKNELKQKQGAADETLIKKRAKEEEYDRLKKLERNLELRDRLNELSKDHRVRQAYNATSMPSQKGVSEKVAEARSIVKELEKSIGVELPKKFKDVFRTLNEQILPPSLKTPDLQFQAKRLGNEIRELQKLRHAENISVLSLKRDVKSLENYRKLENEISKAVVRQSNLEAQRENIQLGFTKNKAKRDQLVPPEKQPEPQKEKPKPSIIVTPILDRIAEIERNINFIGTMNKGVDTVLKSMKENVKQAEKMTVTGDISKLGVRLESLNVKNKALESAVSEIVKQTDSLEKLKSWDYVSKLKSNLEKAIAETQRQIKEITQPEKIKKTSEQKQINNKATADQYYEKAKLHSQLYNFGVGSQELINKIGLKGMFENLFKTMGSYFRGVKAEGFGNVLQRLGTEFNKKFPKTDFIDNMVNAIGRLKLSDLPNVNDVYKKTLGAVSPVVQRLQSDFVGIVDSTQSFGTAVSKAFELVGNTRSLEKATEGLTGLKKGFAVASVAAEAGVRIFSAGVVGLLGFENTLENFARPALEAQNALYIMSLGMHSTIDDMKQLSIITQVAGVNMTSVQTALRRVNAQLAKTSEGSKLAKETLKHYGAELFDKNGNMKQGMAQLDEIAKAYQNAMVQGRGAEFRYRVGGRYWDNDFVALISDYAANKDAMYKIVKSNLADPKLAYSVRGSMYGLEAQQKQMWTSFSSAFMPVVEHVAPQMKQRFAELTKIIEQNSEGIKGFGFVLGEAIVSLSEFGTSAVKWASEMLRLLDLGRGERIASQVIADKQKEINDSADEILKVQRDSGGGVLKSDNKALYTLMVEQKLPKELMEQIKLYREIFSQKGLTVAQKRNSGLGMVITAEEINLEKRQKELAKDFGDELSKLAKAALTAERVLNRFGEVDPEKVVDQLERALAGKLTALGDDFLDPNTVKKLQSDAQTFAIEYTKKNYDSEQVKEYETYRRLQDEFDLLKKERSLRQNGADTDEYIEWIKGLNFDDRVKLRKAKKDEEALRFNDLGTIRGRVKDMLDDIETVQEEYLRKVAEGVAGAANRIKNEKDSNENEDSAVLSEAYEDLVKKAEKFEEINKNLQYDLKYGADEYTKSIAKLNEEYEKNLDILLKQRQVALEKYRKSGSDVDLAEAEKNLELYRKNYQLQKAIADQKHNDEFKKIEEETAKMQFDSTHTEFEKQMRDIEELTKAQLKKAKTAEEVAKVIANAAQKETKAFEDEIDKMRGKFRSVEEEIFRLTHSRYEYEQMKIMREATDNIKNAQTEREAERYRLLAHLKLGELQRNVKAEDLKRPNNRPVQVFDFSALEDVDYEVGQDLKAHYDSLEKPKYIDKKPEDFPDVQENIKAFSDLFKSLDAKVLKSAFYILDGNVRKSAVAAQEKAKADSDAATAVEVASNTVKNSSQNVREEFGKLAEAAEGLGFNISGFLKKTADDRNKNGGINVLGSKKELTPNVTPIKGMPTKTTDLPTQPAQQTKPTDDVAFKLKEAAQKIAGKDSMGVKVFDSISRRIAELTKIVGGIARDINEKKTQPAQINVSPTISLNLSGSYVLTQAMVNQIANDCTEQVANGVYDAVTRATNNLRI